MPDDQLYLGGHAFDSHLLLGTGKLADADTLVRAVRAAGTPLVTVRAAHIACELDADGVHLGQGDLSLPEARRRGPVPGKRFGRSTHNAAQARAALAWEPDYIGIGPVFATPTKASPDPVVGLAVQRSRARARVSGRTGLVM